MLMQKVAHNESDWEQIYFEHTSTIMYDTIAYNSLIYHPIQYPIKKPYNLSCVLNQSLHKTKIEKVMYTKAARGKYFNKRLSSLFPLLCQNSK